MRSNAGRPYRRLIACNLTALLACGEPHVMLERPLGGTVQLAGVWDAHFVIDRPPLGRDTAELRRTRGDRVHGTIAFLPLNASARTNGANRWDVAGSAQLAFAAWDIDFSPVGFDLRPSGGFPSAVAVLDTSGGRGTTGGSAPSTIRIVLGPESAVRIVLSGTWHGDSVAGRWRVVADQRSRLSAGGDFTLVSRTQGIDGSRRNRSAERL